MAPPTLSRLLKANSALTTLLQGMDEEVCILDINGAPLWVSSQGSKPRAENTAQNQSPLQGGQAPILIDGNQVGWVSGGSRPLALAGLIAYAAAQENEKKSLAAEVLDRYRELNLLYHLSESLGASPHPATIAGTALAAAIRIIPAWHGQILLRTGEAQTLQNYASHGSEYGIVPGASLVERVLATGKAELTNAVSGEEIFLQAAGQQVSVLCAPLKTEKNMLGVILLASPPEKAFTAGELKLLNTIAQQAAPMIEISRLYQIEIEKASLENELQMARKVQESLLPEKMPLMPGWQFARRWRPKREVSGDFYDVIRESPQRLGLVTADVTGKGLPASLFMVFVRSVLRASVTRRTPPGQAVANTNRVICQDSNQGLLATLFYARLETDTGELAWVNAGHPPSLLYRKSDDSLHLLRHTGLPLGVDTSSTYAAETIWLQPGDFLLLYTDGMIESENEAGEEFGLERLQQEVYTLRGATPSVLLDTLEKILSAFTYPRQIDDDLTLMVVRRE